MQSGEKYRTADRAGDTVIIPSYLAIISCKEFMNALEMNPDQNAYMCPISYDDESDNIEFKEDRLYMNSLPVGLDNIDSIISDTMPDIDLPFLHLLFSTIISNRQSNLNEGYDKVDIVEVYIPHIFKAIEKSANTSSNDRITVINKIVSYQSIVGITPKGIQPVLNFMGEDITRNTIRFSSPYFSEIINSIDKIRYDSVNNDKRKKKNKDYKERPCYSYLIKSSIVKERNKNAVRNVEIIVVLIEQAGDNLPQIKVNTIIERNTYLKIALEGKSTSNKNTILKRVFEKTFEILEKQTKLKEKYKNIQLPDYRDASNIPTSTTLDKVYSFPHEGKIEI